MTSGDIQNTSQSSVISETFANPGFDDSNPLANGRTLVYGLDFQDNLTPLSDSDNPSKTILYSNFSTAIQTDACEARHYWNHHGHDDCDGYDENYLSWSSTKVKSFGRSVYAYVSGNVSIVPAENYPGWSALPTALGSALNFPTNQTKPTFVEVPDPFQSTTLDNGSFFVEFWMKPAAYTPRSKVVLAKWKDGAKSFMITYYHYNLSVFTSPDGYQTRQNSTSAESSIKYADWNHVAVAFSPTQMKIYINGLLAQTFGSAEGYYGVYNAPGEPLRIGQGMWGSAWMPAFEGKISDLRIVNGVLTETDPNSSLRLSYGLRNKVSGVGFTGFSGFIDKTRGSDRFFRLMAENSEYASQGYNYEFDWGVYNPPDASMGINRDFMASVDFQLQNSGSDRLHALLSKGWGPEDNDMGHFQLGVLVDHPRCKLVDTAGHEYLLEDRSLILANNIWYRMSLAVNGNTATMQTINLSTGQVSTTTLDITGVVLNTRASTVSIGKVYGHSGATQGFIDNVKIYKN